MTNKMKIPWLLSGLLLTLAATALATVQQCPEGQVRNRDGKCVGLYSKVAVGTSGNKPKFFRVKHRKPLLVVISALKGSGQGQAEVLGTDSGTTVTLELTNFAGQDGEYALYAIPYTREGRQVASLLGNLTVTNGTGRLTANTPLDEFALVLTKGRSVNEITDKDVVAHSTALKPAPQVNKPKSIR